MQTTVLNKIEVALTLAVYDALRSVSRVARRNADRINRIVDVDTLRGYHAYPGESAPVLNFQDRVKTWNPIGQSWECDMERARR